MPLGLSSCRVSGYTLSYRRAGAGDPVVLVHGFLAHSFVWDAVIERLAPRRDVLAPDLLACGGSDKPLDVDLGLGAHAGRLLGFLDALGVARAHLVGHGLGGAVALLAAVRAPSRALTVTAVNPSGYGQGATPLVRLLASPLLPDAAAGALRALGPLLLRRRFGPGGRVRPGLWDAFAAPYATAPAWAALRRFARDVSRRDELSGARGELRRLTVPATVVWGMHDRFRSFTAAERLHQDIPGARLVRLDGAGHLVQLEAPDALAILLEEAFGRA
jgi:pimeloyl-ACP methyl ester carboxylesterase